MRGRPILYNCRCHKFPRHYLSIILQTFLCGLASFGLGCSGAVPGVYTEVSHYVEWIGENVIN